MGFLDDLFLGQGPKLETRSLSTISPEQRQALNALLSSLGKAPTKYGGQLSTGLTDLEQSSLAALEERSRALAQPDQNLEAAGLSIRDQLDFRKNTADANDYFTNAVQNPALKEFGANVLPQISRQFGGNDFFSTERQNAEATARRDLLDSLTAERSRVNLDEFDKARDRALTAAGIAPGLTAAENSRTQSQMDILKAAGVERQVGQDALDRTYAEFVRQQQAASHQQDLLHQASLTPTIENIGMNNPGNAGLIPSLLGSIAGGVGQNLGGLLGDKLGGLLNRGGPIKGGGSAADGAGSSAGGAAGAIGAGGAAAGGAVAGGGGAVAGGGAVPGGSVIISDAAGNIIPSVAGGAGAIGASAGLEGLLGSGISAGVAGTTAAGAAELGSIAAPTLSLGGGAAGGAGAALGGGASADAAGAAAGGLGTGGVSLAGLGIAALPLAIAAYGLQDQETRFPAGAQFLRQMGGTPITTPQGGQLIRLPNGEFVKYDTSVIREIGRIGLQGGSQSDMLKFLESLPRIGYKIPITPGRQLPGKRGGVRSED